MIKKIILFFINFFLIKIFSLILILKKKIRRIRKIDFENFSDKYKLYSNKYFFILFGQDQYVSRQTYIHGPNDYHLFKKARKLINKKIKYLIDVGANIGTFCIPAVVDGYIKKCVAIEPIKEINDILKVNIILNQLKQKIIVYDYLISNKICEKLSLKINKKNFGDNRFKVNNKSKLKLKICKLDHFVKKFNLNELLIKIDVQGFEAKVLDGAKKFLSNKVPLIVEFDYNFIKSKEFIKIKNSIKKYYRYMCVLDQKVLKKENIIELEDKFINLKKNKSHFNCLIF